MLITLYLLNSWHFLVLLDGVKKSINSSQDNISFQRSSIEDRYGRVTNTLILSTYARTLFIIYSRLTVFSFSSKYNLPSRAACISMRTSKSSGLTCLSCFFISPSCCEKRLNAAAFHLMRTLTPLGLNIN